MKLYYIFIETNQNEFQTALHSSEALRNADMRHFKIQTSDNDFPLAGPDNLPKMTN